MLDIYVDADACPVKDEVFRVAERYGLKVYLVANGAVRAPLVPWIERVAVDGGFDAADDWIADRIGAKDIVVTADIPLADRCLKRGARAIGPGGRPFTPSGIGHALAMRGLMRDLRDMGEVRGGAPPFSKQDRSRFLSALDDAIQAIRRGR